MVRKRRKRQQYQYDSSPGRKAVYFIIAVVAVAAIGTAGYKIQARGQEAGKISSEVSASSVQTTEQGQTQDNTVLPELQAGSVVLTGLTAAEAEEKLRTAYDWDLKVVDVEERAEVENLTEAWLGQVLEDIGKGNLPENGRFEPDYDAMETKLNAFAAQLGQKWDSQPADSQVESFDKKTGVYSYTSGKNGRTLKQELLVQQLLSAVREGRLHEEVQAEFAETAPSRTSQQAKEQYRVIGTFSTKTTDNKNRNQNIRLAVEAIDGTVLKPGQEFSFNTATGNRTSEKGYQPAGAYKNGVLVEEPGGGVCQVSTTLYHAIIESGYKTTERNAHSFAPSYVEKGQDAMVSFDGYAGPDLKFVNTGSSAVVLRASFDGKNLKMSIVGLPILEEGVKVTIRSEKVRDVPAGEPVYEENPALQPGTEKTVDQGASGSVWKSFRITTKNGETLKEEPLHNSSYKAKTAVIQKNSAAAPPESTAVPGEAGNESTPVNDPAAGGNPQPGESGQVNGNPLPEENGQADGQEGQAALPPAQQGPGEAGGPAAGQTE